MGISSLPSTKKIKSQRASEDIRIAEHFPSEEEAGRVTVVKALKTIKKSDASYGPYETASLRQIG